MTPAAAGTPSRDRRLALAAVAVSLALHGALMLAWPHLQSERPQPLRRVEIELRQPAPAPPPEVAPEPEPPPRAEPRAARQALPRAQAKKPVGTAKPAAPGVALPLLAAEDDAEASADYTVPERPPLPADLPLPFATAPGTLPPERADESGGGEGAEATPAPEPPPSRPLVAELKLVEHALPAYPRLARIRGIEGYVVVEFILGRDGRVREPRVVETQPPGHFEQAALEAIRGWRYAPVERDGLAIEVTGRQRMEFRLAPG